MLEESAFFFKEKVSFSTHSSHTSSHMPIKDSSIQICYPREDVVIRIFSILYSQNLIKRTPKI